MNKLIMNAPYCVLILILFAGCIKEQKSSTRNSSKQVEKVEMVESSADNKTETSEIIAKDEKVSAKQAPIIEGRTTAVIHFRKGYLSYYVVKKGEDNKYEILSEKDPFSPEDKQDNSVSLNDPKERKKGMIKAIINEITSEISKVHKFYAICERSIEGDEYIMEYREVIEGMGGITWETYGKNEFSVNEADALPIEIQFVLKKPYFDN